MLDTPSYDSCHTITMLRAAVNAAARRTCDVQRALHLTGAIVQAGSNVDGHAQPWVGCSHWTGPFRPSRSFSTRRDTSLFDDDKMDVVEESNELHQNKNDAEWHTLKRDLSLDDEDSGGSWEGVEIDEVEGPHVAPVRPLKPRHLLPHYCMSLMECRD